MILIANILCPLRSKPWPTVVTKTKRCWKIY